MLFQHIFPGRIPGLETIVTARSSKEKPAHEMPENNSVVPEELNYFSGIDESDDNWAEDFYSEDDDD